MVMAIQKSIFFLCINLFNLLSLSHSRFLLHNCGQNNGNFTTNDTYQENLDAAISSLTFNTTNMISGFYNQSTGQPPDVVYAIGLCRGDVEPGICRSCLNESNSEARSLCPNHKAAVIWYDDCMLRYSNTAILGNMDSGGGGTIWVTNNIPNADELCQSLRRLMERLRTEAAGGDRKFATGNSPGPDFMTLYGLMQCTPDLSQAQCYDCLEAATNRIPSCSNASLDVRVLTPSCNLRYSNSLFYNDTAVLAPPPSPPPTPSLPPPPPPPPPGKNSNTTRTLVIVLVSLVSFAILLVVTICVFVRRTKLKRRSPVNFYEDVDMDEITTEESLEYNFNVIKAATNDFSESNKLGQGGFGPVYKGKLEDGVEIAVKRLSMGSGQGEREFKNEVLLVAKLQHRNLVRLLGFSLLGSERLLMYEFVANGSLDHFIFDPTKRALLDWPRRYKIIGGIARGLLYLHEDSRLRIIHRDLKASNILLDDEMNPKIADFGMAKLFTPEETQANTTRIVGTYGYMAPEYAMHGQFSVKSDVFSFGVLLLEIVTGRNNHSFQNGEVVEDLLSTAWRSWRDGSASSITDPSLRASASLRNMTRCIHIGLLCVQEDVADRPTMASVILMLSSSSLTLPVPSKPAFFGHSSIIIPQQPQNEERTSSTSHSRSSRHSLAVDTSMSELYPR